MSASRAGRKAAPVTAVPFTLISSSMMADRATRRRCTSSSMESISLRSPASRLAASIVSVMAEAAPRDRSRSGVFIGARRGEIKENIDRIALPAHPFRPFRRKTT